MDTQNFDLSNCTRDGLRKVLSTAESEMRKYLNAADNVKYCKKRIKEEREKFKTEQKRFNLKDYLIIAGITSIIVSLCMVFGVHKYEISIFMLLGIVMMIFIVVLIPYLLNPSSKKRTKNIQNDLQKYETQLPNLQKKVDEAENEFNAVLFVPNDYCSPHIMAIMVKFIDNKEADTWKEVTSLYRDYKHKEEMKGIAQETAEYASLQAEYLRQTRNASRMAAAGAWAAAAGIWRR